MSLRDTRAANELPSGEAVAGLASGRAILQAKRAAGGNMRFPDHASYVRYQAARAQIQLRQEFRAARTAQIPVVTVPDPPTNINATGGSEAATVTFIAPTNKGGTEILSYTVTAFVSGTPVKTATANSTSITISGLAANIDHTFTVVATNRVGDSAPSSVSNIVRPTPTPVLNPITQPDPPSVVNLQQIELNKVRVSISYSGNDGGSPINKYTVTYTRNDIADAPPTTIVVPKTAEQTVTEIEGLTGSQYIFSVTATNGGPLTSNAVMNIITLATAPAPPNVSLTPNNASINVSVSPNVIALPPDGDGGSAIISYIWKTSFNSTEYIVPFSPPPTNFTITGLPNNAPCTVFVKAQNQFGASAFAEATATPVATVSYTSIRSSGLPTSYVKFANSPSSSFAIGSQNFTIEWFQYWEAGVAPFPRVFSIGSFPGAGAQFTPADIAVSYEGNLLFWKNGASFSVGLAPPQNQWVHMAIVGTGSQITVYQNGNQKGMIAGPYDFTNDTYALTLFNESFSTEDSAFKGNITNFRWVIGTAVYMAPFTVPSIPLPQIGGTELLLLTADNGTYLNDSSVKGRTADAGSGISFSPA
jgi:hypothetical protein